MSVFPPFKEDETATKNDINAFRCAKSILFIGTLAILCSILIKCNSNKTSDKPSTKNYKTLKQLNNIKYNNVYTFQKIR